MKKIKLTSLLITTSLLNRRHREAIHHRNADRENGLVPIYPTWSHHKLVPVGGVPDGAESMQLASIQPPPDNFYTVYHAPTQLPDLSTTVRLAQLRPVQTDGESPSTNFSQSENNQTLLESLTADCRIRSWRLRLPTSMKCEHLNWKRAHPNEMSIAVPTSSLHRELRSSKQCEKKFQKQSLIMTNKENPEAEQDVPNYDRGIWRASSSEQVTKDDAITLATNDGR